MVTFNYTKEFLRQAKRLTKRYRSLPDDINSLQHDLIENPGFLLPCSWQGMWLRVQLHLRQNFKHSNFL
jgi:hypothetical protein